MSNTISRTAGQRVGLSRRQIVEAALRFIDENAAGALSMHKLGAALDVKAMSLYNHVTNKDDVLDGVVELLWEEVEAAAQPQPDWRQSLRGFARAVRDVVHAHPNAGPLIFSQNLMPTAALRWVQAHVRALAAAGFPESRAYDLLRTLTSFVLGASLAEITWDRGEPGCSRDVRELLRPGTPDDLAAVADIFCGQAHYDDQFEMGLELMLRGIDEPDRSGTGNREPAEVGRRAGATA